MEMNENLFNEIVNTAQDCVFWKDTDRRFVGVNQAFLDFYGFESADVLIGRNDEDMGWHSDPGPYREDELRVLQGESTYKVPGKCFIRGEERDIVASKHPLYENGEIIGLVGSFADVTGVVRRQVPKNDGQTVYTREQLLQYPYFNRLLQTIRTDDVLDHLTGILSRSYILEFAHSLITSGTPFTFAIVDLDNFKYINDTYGHHAGDAVLMSVAKNLAKSVMGFGLAGRFGGDEFLLIDLRDITYQEKKDFFENLYVNARAVRKDVRVDGQDLFVTATTGCATYPNDADNYEDLFRYVDKTLYRGKDKGRNCYIIYVEEKHRDLEIQKIARQGISTIMQGILRRMESAPGFENKLRSVAPLLAEELRVADLFYVDLNGVLYSAVDPDVREDAGDIGNLMKEEIFHDHSLQQVMELSPVLFESLKKLKTQSVLIVRIGMGTAAEGYLICSEPRSQRIWQDDEIGVMYFLAQILADRIRLEGDKVGRS
ncbi:MAG: GGDEF domain-containing protein [Lachnospiraceae bacterium]|nr:GGDEF domain-containing protein [Lachnospiraceae bacterium]